MHCITGTRTDHRASTASVLPSEPRTADQWSGLWCTIVSIGIQYYNFGSDDTGSYSQAICDVSISLVLSLFHWVIRPINENVWEKEWCPISQGLCLWSNFLARRTHYVDIGARQNQNMLTGGYTVYKNWIICLWLVPCIISLFLQLLIVEMWTNVPSHSILSCSET